MVNMDVILTVFYSFKLFIIIITKSVFPQGPNFASENKATKSNRSNKFR